MSEKTAILADPRGSYADVDRAINIVERTLEEFGALICVCHEVVHDKFVMDNLREKDTAFIENLSEVPAGAALICSAHGVPRAIQEGVKACGFRVFDVTCPLVAKVHKEVARLNAQDCEIIMIDRKGHVEVEGTMGQLPPDKMFPVETIEGVTWLEARDPDKLAYVSQATLLIDKTKDITAAPNARFPNICSPHKEDVYYATTNRRKVVKELAEERDLVIMAGSPNSSNSNRLREATALCGVDTYMADNTGYLRHKWLEGKNKTSVTTDVSVPEVLVKEVLQTIQKQGHETTRKGKGAEESIIFALPKELGRKGGNKQALNKG